MHRKKEFLKSVIYKEAMRELLLCEISNDLTSPTSNQIPDIHIAVSVVYGTFQKFFFDHSYSYCFILHSKFEMKVGVLLQ